MVSGGIRGIAENWRSPVRLLSQGLAQRRISRWAALLPKVASYEEELQALDTFGLRKRSLSLRYRLKSNEPVDRLLPEAFALVREAARRTINMRHFDVQILGGVAMHHCSIVEMQTGEGKTLTATLPLYLAALEGKGAHLSTVNDYLARRDAQWMGPVYECLGISVGVVETQMSRAQRHKAYACDITYGTAKEFGFDFLRDRLLLRRIGEGQSDFLGGMLGMNSDAGGERPVQRTPFFVLVDEADSILIDEARTPLIISALPNEAQRIAVEAYKWAASVAREFEEDEHYDYDHEERKIELTPEGRRLVRMLPKPDAMHAVGMFSIYEYVERAVKVDREYFRDRQYVVRDGEVVIVDEFTGRMAEGRKWRSGIHQAVEAAEDDVEVTAESGQAARVTVQDYFHLYPRLAGMTGTAISSAAELTKIYKVRVLLIPTNRPTIRERLPERVFGTADEKWHAIVDEVSELYAVRRPVLIGTRSIDKSEHLAALLQEKGIEVDVLNANHIADEADIVARAGRRGKVTVSTNMAGRGTDIKLEDGVAELGGLHVIVTEMHDAARIDRQLAGRCGRQGDPGTYRIYLSLEDELLVGLSPEKARYYKELGQERPGRYDHLARLFRKAQRSTERKHFRDRKILMYHEKERKKVQVQMGQDPYLDTPG
ncbi:MAG: preprotein translocase subunit SecA [Pirellulales bacterium]